MIRLGCDCLTVVTVIGSDSDIRKLILDHPRWEGEHYPCVAGCGRTMFRLQPYEAKKLMGVGSAIKQIELTPEECFKAMCGFGLPDELGTGPEVLKALLLQSRIVDLSVRLSPSGRAILDRLDLEDGTSIHMASSPQGPSVFKITRRTNGSMDNDQCGLLQGAGEDGLQRDDRGGQGECGGSVGGDGVGGQ